MLVTGKLLTTSRRNNRPYAVLRASHNYLVTDFFLTLLLHLSAALPHLRPGKRDILNLGKTPAIADLVIASQHPHLQTIATSAFVFLGHASV